MSDELALSEDPVARFTDTLIEIANQTIPKSHISKNKLPKVPWFNDVCKQAIKERKKAQRKLFRNPTAENVLAFKQLKAKARHIIKTQKKTSWQSFCSSLTSKTKPKTVWKAIRKIKGKKSTSSLGHLKVNGKLITDKKQIANLLASTISNNSSQLYSPKFQAIKKQNEKKLVKFTSDNTEDYNQT
ncbi:hypothetical protein, partial [Thiolapillus sp.]|uniref:hypothetical protein n=1 Tax=Thiolapillus sp. TaxID=2017437 RepID=UPI003AF9D09C